MHKKGKIIVGEAKQPRTYSENMDLDVDLESIFYNLDQIADIIHPTCSMDMVDTLIFYEDESYVFHNVVFESE
jgi:hypothetical protein